MAKNEKYYIENYEDIESYLRGFADGDDVLAHLLCQSMSGVLEGCPSNLRPYDEERDVAGDNMALNSIRRDIFNSAAYVFDPSLNPELDQQVRDIASYIKATMAIEKHGWSNKIDMDKSPGFLQGNFLQAAMHSTVGNFDLDVDAATESNKNVPSVVNNQPAIDEVMIFEDGRRIVEYRDTNAFMQDHRLMDYCLGRAVDFDDSNKVFYALYDLENNPHIMFELRDGNHTLIKALGKDRMPAEEHLFPYVRDFAKSKNVNLTDEVHNTGLLKKIGEYYDIFNLPEGFEYNRTINLKNITRPFTLNLKRLKGKGYTHLDLSGSSGISSIKGIEYINGNVTISGTNVTEIPKGFDKGYRILTDIGKFDTVWGVRRAFKKHYGTKPQQAALPAPR